MDSRAPSTAQGGGERIAVLLISVVSVVIVVVVGLLFLGDAPRRGSGGSSALPTLNASLNATSALLLGVGYACIRRGRIAAHRACMIGAFAVSALFLVSYVTYHATSPSRAFTGVGWIRWVYFPLLISHILLAIAILPLALLTLYRAARGDITRHRRIARWTLPLWLYVSLTGVAVYLMLY